MHGLDLRYIHLGPDSVIEVVREGSEGDVADHLYDLLVGVARLPHLFDRIVGDVPAVLGDITNEREGRGPLRVVGLEPLSLLALLLDDALLLRNCGVDGQSIHAAVEVRDGDGDQLLHLAVERAFLHRPGEVHVCLERRR